VGLYIPTFADPLSLRLHEKREKQAFKQSEYIDRKTKEAESGKQRPEMVDGDVSDERLATSMSWDFSPGWEDRRVAEVRAMRERGEKFDPAVRRPLPGGGFENIYPYGEVDLLWFEKGLCCVRCRNWKAQTDEQHARDHEKLQKVTGVRPPEGIELKDLCGHCGARLDTQKFRTKAA